MKIKKREKEKRGLNENKKIKKREKGLNENDKRKDG